MPGCPNESWKRLRLLALDPTDIGLSKLERNVTKPLSYGLR
jgi:hypothetical protein